jgi:predicted esterase
MLQKNIIIPKTARYFILGEPSDQIEQIWFVCHGYGQLANYFIKNFEQLNNGKNLIATPEGLHRFYWKGFSDKVVASWMTKEDRNEVIGDNDEFINEQQIQEHQQLLIDNHIQFELIRFKGKHEIDSDTLLQLAERLSQENS